MWRRSGRAVRVVALVVCFVGLLTFNAGRAGDAPSPVVPPAAPASSDAAPAPAPAPAPEPPVVQAAAAPASWRSSAAATIDRTTLTAGGVAVPEGANVFAARIVDGGSTPAYMLYEAGGGAFSGRFHPASSVKLLVAVAALELAHAAGFTGEAVVDGTYTLAEHYDAAVRWSSNEDYDALVRLAGVAWLNEEFLPSRGYPSTHIQEAYAGGDGVSESPAIHLAEAGRELVLPERRGGDDYGCGTANCSTLFELADSVRRVVLDGELPAGERFSIDPADVAGLRNALAGAESWIGPGVAEVLGPDARVYSKPGWGSGLDCVDVALVDGAGAGRYLIGVSAPDDGECAMLAGMAAEVVTVVAHDGDGDALRRDGSVVRVVDGRQQAP